MTMPSLVCIVDAYSAANQYPAELRRRGHTCIHIQSTPEIPGIYARSFRAEDFIANVVHAGDLQSTLDKLRPLQPRSLFAGIESGVELADQLSEALALISNGTRMSRARRDKHAMWKAVADHGLPVGSHFASDRLDEILAWVGRQGSWPVVIKPTASAGTDRVTLCYTPTRIAEAFSAILNHRNLIGEVNREVLAQERLIGTEYVVNMVSCAGRRCITDLWRYTKIAAHGGDFVYDRDDLCSIDGTVERGLADYVSEVLDALEIQYGPTHTEVYMTSQGPRLIEVGARVDGGADPSAIYACTGRNPFALTTDAYLDQGSFRAEADKPYRLQRQACMVALISHQEGVITAMPRRQELEALPSFCGVRLRQQIGDLLRPTSNVETLPGIVQLAHVDRAVIEADYARIRRWEQEHSFWTCGPVSG